MISLQAFMTTNMRAFRTSEEKYIREHYGSTPISKIAAHLGRHKGVVASHIKLMGLNLTDEQRKQSKPLKAGQQAHNKGKAGKPNQTSFKVGCVPANTKFDGAISTRQKHGQKPYDYIRIAPRKWVLLHHYNWENENGPIPPGYVLRCVDGDTQNCWPWNWELVTRRESLNLNRNEAKVSEALKHRWKVRKAIAKHRAEFPALFE